MKKILVILITTQLSTSIYAQDTAIANPQVSLSVFADAYYSYDFNQPANHGKPAFLYSHNRHNEFTINLAYLKAAYASNKLRANFALAAGTYMNANYAAESGVLKNIYEANIGVKVSKAANLWVDAGVFPSHIGFESAHSPSCWTLTRSMMAENSPYYEAGAKLTYTSNNEKWLLSGLLLNGWQRIRRVDANNTPALGTQITYSPTSKATFNWSTFIGNDYPDSVKKWRYFHNFYMVLQPSRKFGITLGFDVGWEQATKGSNDLNTWYTPIVVFRFTPNNNWAVAARGEYYSDKNGVIISTGTPNSFRTIGASLNADRKIADNFWWRTELRTLSNKEAIFIKEGKAVSGNTFITSSFAVTL